MLFSASYAYSYTYYGNSYKFIVRQAALGAVGVAIMLILSNVDYHIYRKFAWPIFFGSLALLIILLILSPMISGMDVKRWIIIGPINFQPTEIAKFAIILLLSHLIAANQKQMGNIKLILFLFALIGLTCVLVVLEPHLSATVLIFCIGVLLLIIGGMKWIHLGAFAGIGVGGVVLALITGVVGYGGDRIKDWLDPWADPMGKGYQTIQSL